MEQIDTNKILSEVIVHTAKNAVSSGWNKVKKFFKDLDAQNAILYGKAYEDYLVNTISKNGKIKTIIYRRVPKDLYSFYECIGVDYEGQTIDTSSITNFLKIGNKFIVTGTGGIGKTILLKHLFLNAVESTDYIPVMIELRKFNSCEVKDISLFDAIYQTLKENGFTLEEEYFEYSLKEGAYIILLDGFDEVNRDKTDKVTSEIRSLSNQYNSNRFIVTSRPLDDFIGWHDFSEMSALPLTKEQALNLVHKIEFDDTVKSTFCEALEHELFDKYKSFASNPLLLTIMLLTFTNHASIPDKLNDFYEEAFLTLFNMHDATKECYVRDIRTKLGSEDFKAVFSYICFKSYFSGDIQFSEAKLRDYIQQAKNKFSRLQFTVDDFQEDLIQSVCMIVKEGLDYRFTHRSFQEYFAALYTCKLTDEVQSQLLTSWLGESNAVVTDQYLTMLFNFQPEKVNKIILCPGIKKLKKLYDTVGFSEQLLEHLFSGLIVRKQFKDGKAICDIDLTIKDYYLCNIIRMTNKLNGYFNRDNADVLADPIVCKLLSGKAQRRSLSFEDAYQQITADELVSALQWFHNDCKFCFSILEQNALKGISRKKRVTSIINEL